MSTQQWITNLECYHLLCWHNLKNTRFGRKLHENSSHSEIIQYSLTIAPDFVFCLFSFSLLLDWTFGVANSCFLFLTKSLPNIQDLNTWVSILFADDFPWSFRFMQHYTHNGDVTKNKNRWESAFLVSWCWLWRTVWHIHVTFENQRQIFISNRILLSNWPWFAYRVQRWIHSK